MGVVSRLKRIAESWGVDLYRDDSVSPHERTRQMFARALDDEDPTTNRECAEYVRQMISDPGTDTAELQRMLRLLGVTQESIAKVAAAEMGPFAEEKTNVYTFRWKDGWGEPNDNHLFGISYEGETHYGPIEDKNPHVAAAYMFYADTTMPVKTKELTYDEFYDSVEEYEADIKSFIDQVAIPGGWVIGYWSAGSNMLTFRGPPGGPSEDQLTEWYTLLQDIQNNIPAGMVYGMFEEGQYTGLIEDVLVDLEKDLGASSSDDSDDSDLKFKVGDTVEIIDDLLSFAGAHAEIVDIVDDPYGSHGPDKAYKVYSVSQGYLLLAPYQVGEPGSGSGGGSGGGSGEGYSKGDKVIFYRTDESGKKVPEYAVVKLDSYSNEKDSSAPNVYIELHTGPYAGMKFFASGNQLEKADSAGGKSKEEGWKKGDEAEWKDSLSGTRESVVVVRDHPSDPGYIYVRLPEEEDDYAFPVPISSLSVPSSPGTKAPGGFWSDDRGYLFDPQPHIDADSYEQLVGPKYPDPEWTYERPVIYRWLQPRSYHAKDYKDIPELLSDLPLKTQGIGVYWSDDPWVNSESFGGYPYSNYSVRLTGVVNREDVKYDWNEILSRDEIRDWHRNRQKDSSTEASLRKVAANDFGIYSPGDFSVGDRVVDIDGDAGEVIEIDEEGDNILVDFDENIGENWIKSSDLIPEDDYEKPTGIDGFEEGDTVWDYDGDQAELTYYDPQTETFEALLTNGDTIKYNSSEISHDPPTGDGNFSIGDMVYDTDGDLGEIVEYDPEDKDFKVQFGGADGPTIWNSADNLVHEADYEPEDEYDPDYPYLIDGEWMDFSDAYEVVMDMYVDEASEYASNMLHEGYADIFRDELRQEYEEMYPPPDPEEFDEEIPDDLYNELSMQGEPALFDDYPSTHHQQTYQEAFEAWEDGREQYVEDEFEDRFYEEHQEIEHEYESEYLTEKVDEYYQENPKGSSPYYAPYSPSYHYPSQPSFDPRNLSREDIEEVEEATGKKYMPHAEQMTYHDREKELTIKSGGEILLTRVEVFKRGQLVYNQRYEPNTFIEVPDSEQDPLFDASEYEEPDTKPQKTPPEERPENVSTASLRKTGEVPPDRENLYWRVHWQDVAEFSPENASSTPYEVTFSQDQCPECEGLGYFYMDDEGEDIEDCDYCGGEGYMEDNEISEDTLEGYSCVYTPQELLSYFDPPPLAATPLISPSTDEPVVAFTGREVGKGEDGEPLVVPDMREVHWMTFGELLNSYPEEREDYYKMRRQGAMRTGESVLQRLKPAPSLSNHGEGFVLLESGLAYCDFSDLSIAWNPDPLSKGGGSLEEILEEEGHEVLATGRVRPQVTDPRTGRILGSSLEVLTGPKEAVYRMLEEFPPVDHVTYGKEMFSVDEYASHDEGTLFNPYPYIDEDAAMHDAVVEEDVEFDDREQAGYLQIYRGFGFSNSQSVPDAIQRIPINWDSAGVYWTDNKRVAKSFAGVRPEGYSIILTAQTDYANVRYDWNYIINERDLDGVYLGGPFYEIGYSLKNKEDAREFIEDEARDNLRDMLYEDHQVDIEEELRDEAIENGDIPEGEDPYDYDLSDEVDARIEHLVEKRIEDYIDEYLEDYEIDIFEMASESDYGLVGVLADHFPEIIHDIERDTGKSYEPHAEQTTYGEDESEITLEDGAEVIVTDIEVYQGRQLIWYKNLFKSITAELTAADRSFFSILAAMESDVRPSGDPSFEPYWIVDDDGDVGQVMAEDDSGIRLQLLVRYPGLGNEQWVNEDLKNRTINESEVPADYRFSPTHDSDEDYENFSYYSEDMSAEDVDYSDRVQPEYENRINKWIYDQGGNFWIWPISGDKIYGDDGSPHHDQMIREYDIVDAGRGYYNTSFQQSNFNRSPFLSGQVNISWNPRDREAFLEDVLEAFPNAHTFYFEKSGDEFSREELEAGGAGNIFRSTGFEAWIEDDFLRTTDGPLVPPPPDKNLYGDDALLIWPDGSSFLWDRTEYQDDDDPEGIARVLLSLIYEGYTLEYIDDADPDVFIYSYDDSGTIEDVNINTDYLLRSIDRQGMLFLRTDGYVASARIASGFNNNTRNTFSGFLHQYGQDLFGISLDVASQRMDFESAEEALEYIETGHNLPYAGEEAYQPRLFAIRKVAGPYFDNAFHFEGEDLGQNHKFVISPEGEMYAWNKNEGDFGEALIALEQQGVEELDPDLVTDWKLNKGLDTYEIFRRDGWASGNTSSGGFMIVNAPSGLSSMQAESLLEVLRLGEIQRLVVHDAGKKRFWNNPRDAMNELALL